MCKFSESNRQKLGNAVNYIAAHARHPYKTVVLKLLFLMEERMVQQFHVPFLGIPFNTWRMGPVSVDVFEELSDGPVMLADFITLEFNGQGIKSASKREKSQAGLNFSEQEQTRPQVKVTPKKEFCDDEFSNQEIQMMKEVMEQYGWMNSDQLIAETHKEGSLWHQTAMEYDLLEDFNQKRANTSTVVIDMARGLGDADREYYQETLNLREKTNLMQMEHERRSQQGLSKERIHKLVAERAGLIDLETMRRNMHQMVSEVYSRP